MNYIEKLDTKNRSLSTDSNLKNKLTQSHTIYRSTVKAKNNPPPPPPPPPKKKEEEEKAPYLKKNTLQKKMEKEGVKIESYPSTPTHTY